MLVDVSHLATYAVFGTAIPPVLNAPVNDPPTYTSVPDTAIALHIPTNPDPNADHVLVSVFHLAIPNVIVMPLACENAPPTYTSVPDTAIAKHAEFNPVPNADHAVPLHLAIIAVPAMPPANVNDPPTYTLVPDTAIALHVLFNPDVNADHVLVIVFHLAILLTVVAPACVNVPPAYISVPDAAIALHIVPVIPVDNADHTDPFHLAIRDVFATVTNGRLYAFAKVPPAYTSDPDIHIALHTPFNPAPNSEIVPV